MFCVPAIGKGKGVLTTSISGAPFSLAFTTQPGNAVAGQPFGTQPVVTVRDSGGNTVTGYTGNVTMEVHVGGGALSGTLSVPAVAGVATFTNLQMSNVETGVSLQARIVELDPQLFYSASFDVAAIRHIARLTDPYVNASVGGIQFTKSDLNGSLSQGLTSWRKVFIQADATSIGLVFENTFYGSQEVANSNAITIKASVETSGGVIIPLTFSGVSSTSLAGGLVIASDVSPLALAAGDFVWILVFVQVAPGNLFPFNVQLNAGVGEGDNQLLTATAPIDARASGHGAPGGGAAANLSYTASAIIGATASSSVLIVGDSIATGSNDAANTVPETYQAGYIVRALYGHLPLCRVSVNSETAAIFNGSGAVSRRALFPWFSHLFCEYGFNDVVTTAQSAATVSARLLTLWQNAESAGLRVLQTVITSQTTTSGDWTTEVQQTVNAQCVLGGQRDLLNVYINSAPAPVVHVFDPASALFDPANNKWLAAAPQLTNDGTHPTEAGHILAAATVSPAAIT